MAPHAAVDFGQVLHVNRRLHPNLREVRDEEHLILGLDVLAEGRMPVEDRARDRAPHLVAVRDDARAALLELLDLLPGDAQGLQLAHAGLEVEPRPRVCVLGGPQLVLRLQALLEELLPALVVALRQSALRDRRHESGPRLPEVHGLDGGEGSSFDHLVAERLVDLTDGAGDARGHVRDTVLRELHLARHRQADGDGAPRHGGREDPRSRHHIAIEDDLAVHDVACPLLVLTLAAMVMARMGSRILLSAPLDAQLPTQVERCASAHGEDQDEKRQVPLEPRHRVIPFPFRLVVRSRGAALPAPARGRRRLPSTRAAPPGAPGESGAPCPGW